MRSEEGVVYLLGGEGPTSLVAAPAPCLRVTVRNGLSTPVRIGTGGTIDGLSAPSGTQVCFTIDDLSKVEVTCEEPAHVHYVAMSDGSVEVVVRPPFFGRPPTAGERLQQHVRRAVQKKREQEDK